MRILFITWGLSILSVIQIYRQASDTNVKVNYRNKVPLSSGWEIFKVLKGLNIKTNPNQIDQEAVKSALREGAISLEPGVKPLLEELLGKIQINKRGRVKFGIKAILFTAFVIAIKPFAALFYWLADGWINKDIVKRIKGEDEPNAFYEKHPYYALVVREGMRFGRSFAYMWTIGAEIGVIVKIGEILGNTPQLGAVGDFCEDFISSLEGSNYGKNVSALSWGYYGYYLLTDYLGFNPQASLYNFLGGEKDLNSILREFELLSTAQAKGMKIDKINESVERLVDLAKNNPEEAVERLEKEEPEIAALVELKLPEEVKVDLNKERQDSVKQRYENFKLANAFADLGLIPVSAENPLILMHPRISVYPSTSNSHLTYQSDISKQDIPYVIYYTNEKVIPVLNKNQTILNITHEGNVFKKIPYIEIANQPDESLSLTSRYISYSDSFVAYKLVEFSLENNINSSQLPQYIIQANDIAKDINSKFNTSLSWKDILFSDVFDYARKENIVEVLTKARDFEGNYSLSDLERYFERNYFIDIRLEDEKLEFDNPSDRFILLLLAEDFRHLQTPQEVNEALKEFKKNDFEVYKDLTVWLKINTQESQKKISLDLPDSYRIPVLIVTEGENDFTSQGFAWEIIFTNGSFYDWNISSLIQFSDDISYDAQATFEISSDIQDLKLTVINNEGVVEFEKDFGRIIKEESLNGWEYFDKGWEYWRKADKALNSGDSDSFQNYLKEAQGYFEKAVQVNPNFTSAYEGIGSTSFLLWNFNGEDKSLLDESIQAYQKAFQLIPEENHAYRARIQKQIDFVSQGLNGEEIPQDIALSSFFNS